MIKVSEKDWNLFLKDNNPEVYSQDHINDLIESNKELLSKAELNELEKEEMDLVKSFREELSFFTKVGVYMKHPDKLNKSLIEKVFYIREPQVEWDETIEKSEDGEEYGFGTFRKTALNDKLGRTGNLIEKGKRGQLGEIREWKGGKYKKTAQGWVPVSEGKDKGQPDRELSKYNNKRFNYQGITWEVVKRGESQSKIIAITESVKGQEKVIDNKIIDKHTFINKEEPKESKLSKITEKLKDTGIEVVSSTLAKVIGQAMGVQ